MKSINYKKLTAMAVALIILSAGVANAQWNSPNAYGHSTGYGTVYGTYGLASTIQSMYNVARARSQKTITPKAGSTTQSNTTSRVEDSASSQNPPMRVVRNHGAFRPDASVDTATAMADALGDSPTQKELIKKIYATTNELYEKEAAVKGWKNNIAGGLTFFTVIAVAAYHDGAEPSNEGVDEHYKILNAALDDTPELAAVSNKAKQGFNNLMVGFGGMLLAIYTDAKQSGDPRTLADSKKLAGMLIEMVLKTNPENLRIENGRIVMK